MKTIRWSFLFILLMLLVSLNAMGCNKSNMEIVSFENVTSLKLYLTGSKSNAEVVSAPLTEQSVRKEILDGKVLKSLFTSMSFYKNPRIAQYDPGLGVITLGSGKEIRIRINSLEDAFYVLAPEKLKGYYKVPKAARGKLFALQERKVVNEKGGTPN